MLHYTRRNTVKSAAAALTYHCRGFPRCLLMHFIVFTGASWELTASIWLPHWGTLRSSCGTAKLRSTSPCFVSAVVCLCCGCFCVLVELSRVTCRVHRMWASIISRLDNVPTPTPCLHPRQQCQLQPVPSISYINIIFFLWFLFYMGPPSGAPHLKIYQSQQELRCRLINVHLFYVDDGVLKVYLQFPHSY